MSKFENYNANARDYDKYCLPMGTDAVAAMVLLHTDKKRQVIIKGNSWKILLFVKNSHSQNQFFYCSALNNRMVLLFIQIV